MNIKSSRPFLRCIKDGGAQGRHSAPPQKSSKPDRRAHGGIPSVSPLLAKCDWLLGVGEQPFGLELGPKSCCPVPACAGLCGCISASTAIQCIFSLSTGLSRSLLSRSGFSVSFPLPRPVNHRQSTNPLIQTLSPLLHQSSSLIAASIASHPAIAHCFGPILAVVWAASASAPTSPGQTAPPPASAAHLHSTSTIHRSLDLPPAPELPPPPPSPAPLRLLIHIITPLCWAGSINTAASLQLQCAP